MNNKKIFAVAGIGFAEHEQRLLKSIMRLSMGRTRSYTLTDVTQQEPAEILLVNGDEPDALAVWKAYRSPRPEVPTIIVAAQQPSHSAHHYTVRPIVASRLLKILDQAVLQALKFVPELVTGKKSDSEESDSPKKFDEIQVAIPAISEKRHKYRALVVDDSSAVRKMLELQLRMLGIKADLAESARDAFACLRDSTYDIVFLDVVLPDDPGYQICKAIKKDPAKKKMPVIMLTGKSSPLDRVKGKFSGCDAYLIKPVNQDKFRKTVNQYLDCNDSRYG